MSRARVAVGSVLMVGVLLSSGAVALAAWPLVQAPRSGAEATMAFQPKPDVAGQLKVVQRADVVVPGGLRGQFTHAMIALDLVVDAQGSVTSVRPVTVQVRNANNGGQLSASGIDALKGVIEGITRSLPAGKTPPFTDADSIVRDVDAMRQAASDALTGWRFDPPAAAPAIARVAVVFDLPLNKATAGAAMPISGFAGAAGVPTTTFMARDRRPGTEGILRVGGNIRPPQKVHHVSAVYPEDAKEARVQGVVIIEAKIGPDGNVAEAWVLRSIPLLDGAALDAVRQWRYSPTLLNGAPVPVIMTVTINFALEE